MKLNGSMFDKSYISFPMDMECISLMERKPTSFKSISGTYERFIKFLSLQVFLLARERSFKEIQRRQSGSNTLNWVFIPPGFSKLFCWHGNYCECKFDNMYNMITRYRNIKHK